MQKKFILNLLFVLLLNIIVKPFYILGIDAEILRRTGEDYGMYFSLLGLTYIFNIFLDFGIVNYNTRNIAQHRFLLQKYFSSILTIRIVLSILYFLLVFISAIILEYPPSYFNLLGVLAFNQVLVGFILYMRSNIAGLLLFRYDSIISVLDRFILIAILSFLLWGRNQTEFHIMWFAYAQTFAYALTLLFAVGVLYKRIGVFRIRLNKVFSIALLKQSSPYAILIFLMMIYYRSDAVMLERMSGKEETAIYAQGYRFFEAFNMIGYLFAGLLLPLFSKMLKQKQKVEGLVLTSFRLIFAASFTIAIATYVFRREIIEWRYGEVSQTILERSSESFGMLMLSFVAISSTYIFGTLLTANGNLKKLNRLALLGVILNFVLNYYWIPQAGAYGASLASLVTQVVTVLGQIYLSYRVLQLKISLRDWIPLFLYTSIVGLVLFVYNQFSPDVDWKIGFLIIGIFGAFAAFATKMIDIKKGLKLISLKK